MRLICNDSGKAKGIDLTVAIKSLDCIQVVFYVGLSRSQSVHRLYYTIYFIQDFSVYFSEKWIWLCAAELLSSHYPSLPSSFLDFNQTMINTTYLPLA